MVALGNVPFKCVNEILLQQQALKDKEEQKQAKANKATPNPECKIHIIFFFRFITFTEIKKILKLGIYLILNLNLFSEKEKYFK